jgi:hypothetical protein
VKNSITAALPATAYSSARAIPSSITSRISSEMAETFAISRMYLCSSRRSAGVMTLPPATRGE